MASPPTFRARRAKPLYYLRCVACRSGSVTHTEDTLPVITPHPPNAHATPQDFLVDAPTEEGLQEADGLLSGATQSQETLHVIARPLVHAGSTTHAGT